MKNKQRKLIDKVLMGAVIGGAIGSVLGATVTGKATKTNEKDSKKLYQKVLGLFRREKKDRKELKKIPHEKT